MEDKYKCKECGITSNVWSSLALMVHSCNGIVKRSDEVIELEPKKLTPPETLDSASKMAIIKEYMHDLAMRSVKAQKGNKNKMIDMAMRSAEVRRLRKQGLKTGDELEVVLK